MFSYGSRSYPRAILHVDGDAFFAMCEVAKNPALKGKPVVIGRERGIASALTYEAKAKGVERGMRISEIRKICPDAVILPSDYETYGLYSVRMYNIVRRYTPEVEEYSIDECFADLSGLQRPLGMSYERIAERIKCELNADLGITFTVGLATTKVLAKVASKWRKPNGLTFIPSNEIYRYLESLPIEKVWGIGLQTSAFLKKYRIFTARQFVSLSADWCRENLSKPYIDIWKELRGENVFELETEKKQTFKSVSRTGTFSPPSSSRSFLLSRLSKNIEEACAKIRRHKLVASSFYFFLKTQDFRFVGCKIKLPQAVSVPCVFLQALEDVFDKVFVSGIYYRATGVVLEKLKEDVVVQGDLFGHSETMQKMKVIYKHIDDLDKRYGRGTVSLGSGFVSDKGVKRKQKTDGKICVRGYGFRGEKGRKLFNIPFLGEVK